MRAERETERFSQYELADELGVTRATLSNFELCQAPVSFAVGFEFCRRLDVSPRWLATGEEPKRPFPPLAELKLTAISIQKHTRRGVDFLNGYDSVLKEPIEAWVKANPTEKIVMRMLHGGTGSIAPRFSSAELVSQLQGHIAVLRSVDERLRSAHADIAEALLAEIGARLMAGNRARRARK